jgi:DNA-binding CsgD family transcriptional regulator
VSRPSPHQLLAEVAAIAVAPTPMTVRAQALLESLGRLLHHDAAWISLLDPERRVLPPLARHGYPERVQRYLDTPVYVAETELLGLHRHRPPMRVCDMPVPPSEVPGWADYLQPAGFREGIGVPLITADGRYLGLFAANFEASTPASDTVRDQLAAFAPLIAMAVDPMRTLTTLASLVSDATAGVVVTGDGRTEPLSGLPDHRLLAPGSATLDQVVTYLDDGDRHVAFLTVEQSGDGRRYLKVTVLSCAAVPPGHWRAVVLLAPAGDLYGLAHRELRVLGMLIAGWSHQRIAAHLGLTRHAVAATVEDVRTKLAAPTRAAAVMRAAERGLHLPPAPPAGDRPPPA